jgi:hypothetical protein
MLGELVAGLIYCVLAFEVLATLLLSLPLSAGNAIVKLVSNANVAAQLKIPGGFVVASIAIVLLGACRRTACRARHPGRLGKWRARWQTLSPNSTATMATMAIPRTTTHN